MNAPLDPRTNESFSDGTSKGFILVKSVPMIRGCTPTYLDVQPLIMEPSPSPQRRLGNNVKSWTFYKNNNPPKTVTVDYDSPALDENIAMMLTMFHNEDSTGVAFITPMDSGPTPVLLMDDSVPEDDQRDRLSGIGIDGSVFFNPPHDNVIGQDFMFMGVTEQFSSSGSFFVPEEKIVTNVESVKPQANRLTFTKTPGVPRSQDMFYDMFGEDAGDSVTINSCAIIEFQEPVEFNCLPSGFVWHTSDIDLDVVRNRQNHSDFGQTAITAWVKMNGREGLCFMVYDDSEINNGYFTFPSFDFTRDIRWAIEDHVSANELSIRPADQTYIDALIDNDAPYEFIRTAHFEDLGLDRDYQKYTLRGYGEGDESMMLDKIGGSYQEDYRSDIIQRATTITVTKIPERLRKILFPVSLEMYGHLEFVDIINEGNDITLESCLRLDIDDNVLMPS